MASKVFGTYYSVSQDKLDNVRADISYATKTYVNLDSIYSDSQIASSIFSEQTFSIKACKKFKELSFIVNKNKQIDCTNVKTHDDLINIVGKDAIHQYNHYIQNLYAERELYEATSKIYFKTLTDFQFLIATFAIFLAVLQETKSGSKTKKK